LAPDFFDIDNDNLIEINFVFPQKKKKKNNLPDSYGKNKINNWPTPVSVLGKASGSGP
jgi:hypothetical protein